ncbi:MAG TPA: HAD family hydrolase [Acidimicrobiales bacterium]|nr:HAD family hydrolase [Acidimicrobiales bacterium]
MRAYDAVTFDHWNTLVYEDGGESRGRRINAWLELLVEAGLEATEETVAIAFEAAWDRFLVQWATGRHFDAAQAAGVAVAALAAPVDDVLAARLVAAFVQSGDGVDFHLAEGIEECLATLKEAGVKLGIVCDVGFTSSTILRDHLERRGILRYFDGWSFSDEVGVYKPEAAIFEHALTTVGNPPAERVAHVGDLRRTDIAGANAMGMTSVRYTGVFDDDPQNGPEGDVVVKHHLELPRALGL